MPLTPQKPLSTHASPRDSRTFTGKSDSVSCEVTASFSWVLVHTGFCCDLWESVSPVLWNFCIQIPCKFSVPRQISRLGNLLWALEFLQQCENISDIIVFQFVGRLLGCFLVGLMVTFSKRTYAARCAFQVCCNQSPCPHGRPLLTCASAETQRQVWLRLLWRSLLISLGPGAHKVLLRPLSVSGRYEV